MSVKKIVDKKQEEMPLDFQKKLKAIERVVTKIAKGTNCIISVCVVDIEDLPASNQSTEIDVVLPGASIEISPALTEANRHITDSVLKELYTRAFNEIDKNPNPDKQSIH